MRRHLFLFFMIGTLAVSMGCGSQGTTGSTAGGPVPSDPVGRVVYEFLDAVRCGDTATSSQCLTPLALQRTSELDLNFSPPGSPTAQFRVGAVEMIDAEKAVVECTWTDQDADGVPRDEKITWALKLNAGDWRISGMAADIGPTQPPVVMDFENPGQLAARGKTPAVQPPQGATPLQAAQPPQDPFRTVPR
ncbi:MAG: hypothetical protein SH868_16840 [Bythopirellula sp.]|nr:hypothetical protein [Bythopirellula sp.]